MRVLKRLSKGSLMTTIAVCLLTIIAIQIKGQAAPPFGYNLVWDDEFNGTVGAGPNPSNWNYELGHNNGWGNGEQETYTNSNAVIVADSAATDGRSLDISSSTDGVNYYSSRLDTIGHLTYQYGYIEMRAKVPPGGASYQGYWPAFWQLGADINSVGWPTCGEIDNMEHLCGTKPNTTYQTVHGPGPRGSYQVQEIYTESNDMGLAYHTYAMLWQPNSVTFYVDDVQDGPTITPSSLHGTDVWEFNKPEFVLLNMAIGGTWPGNVTSSTVFPAHYLIDYIRIYENSAPSAPTGLSATQGAQSVSLSWTGSPYAISYNVYRGTTAGGEGSTPIATGVTTTSYTDNNVTPGVTYYYQVAGVNSLGTSAQSNEASATPYAIPMGPVSINCGGLATGSWVADVDFSGGSVASTTAAIGTSQLTGTIPPQTVLQTNRWGAMTYTLPGFAAGSSHTVTLYFAEEFWAASGKRVFNVAINGTTVLSNFDIFATAGGANTAIQRSFATTADSNGNIVIVFTNVVDNAQINAISAT